MAAPARTVLTHDRLLCLRIDDPPLLVQGDPPAFIEGHPRQRSSSITDGAEDQADRQLFEAICGLQCGKDLQNSPRRAVH